MSNVMIGWYRCAFDHTTLGDLGPNARDLRQVPFTRPRLSALRMRWACVEIDGDEVLAKVEADPAVHTILAAARGVEALVDEAAAQALHTTTRRRPVFDRFTGQHTLSTETRPTVPFAAIHQLPDWPPSDVPVIVKIRTDIDRATQSRYRDRVVALRTWEQAGLLKAPLSVVVKRLDTTDPQRPRTEKVGAAKRGVDIDRLLDGRDTVAVADGNW